MYTTYEIMLDFERGCLAHNIIEDRFIYRSGITAKKGTETMKLLSRSYPFSLEKYFEDIEGRTTHEKINRNRKTVCYR